MSLKALDPVDTSALHERVYRHLRHAIVTGMFQPGQPITLRGVAEALGTSVMPVREAVRLLVFEKALEMPNSRSTRVPLMSMRHFENLIALRILVEGEAAAKAAKIAKPADIKRLMALDAQIKSASQRANPIALLEANQAFHFYIYGLSDDELMLSTIETLWLQAGPYHAAIMSLPKNASPKAASWDMEDHAQLIEAIRNNDSRATRKALKNDISASADIYKRVLRYIAGE